MAENHKRAREAWQARKEAYEREQADKNKRIRERQEAYLNKDPDAILDYCELVLSNSRYPDSFPQEYDLDYKPEHKLLIVDYALPRKEDLPATKAVKYVASKDDFTETRMTESALNTLYDNLLYQIVLRTLHELYEADTSDALDAIVFNGWVNAIDKATGREVNVCILSVQATKAEFVAMNLEKVDPKACFKQLKGVGSSKLHGLSPVAPILKIDRDDTRFVSPYDVVNSVDGSTNLAAMDWQDFENLIRELFEKEFASTGGEVKIPRASRDGGVDAIAFDPIPFGAGSL